LAAFGSPTLATARRLVGQASGSRVFLKSERTIGCVNSVGLSKLATRLGIDLANLSVPPDAIGIVLDADDAGAPQDRHDELVREITARPEPEAAQLQVPKNPGMVSDGAQRCGVFVMPDNESSGTLEELLLEAGGQAYLGLQKAATDYVQGIDSVQNLTADDLIELGKPAGRKKAVIAAMASILKPGKAIQVSIQDNRWLETDALQLPRIAGVTRFIQELLR
jgi:hypothetical protein